MADVREALDFARIQHLGQMYGHVQYIHHIKQTVAVAMELGFSDVVQTACALHDILEDTPLSYNDIKKLFGVEVADIVYDVTDELGKNRKERKEKTYPKIRANKNAILVKYCDRIANLRHSKKYGSPMYATYMQENDSFIRKTTEGVHFDDEIVRCLKALNNERT